MAGCVALAAALPSNLAIFLLGQALFAAYGLRTADVFEGESLRLVFVGAAVAPLLPVVALLIGELLPRWWQEHVFEYMLFAASDAIANPTLRTVPRPPSRHSSSPRGLRCS